MKQLPGLIFIHLLLVSGAAHPDSDPVPLSTQESEAHENILATARAFLEQGLADRTGNREITLGNLDRRLRLARCDIALEGYLPPGGLLTGNTSVGVRCNGTQPWKLYVPARVSLSEEVIVAKGYLPRGTMLDNDNIEIAVRDVTGAGHGYLADTQQAFGMVLKQPLQAGLVITPAMLTKPRLIRRGDDVEIVSKTGTFEVRMKGSALGDAAAGDRIKVRNKNSKRIVEGTVNEDGLVMVQM